MKKFKNLKNKLALSLYATTSIIFIEYIGRLMLAEIIALVSLPFLNIKNLTKKYEGLKVVLSSLVILLAALIVSDQINKSIPANYLRGWALIISAMVSTIFFVYYLSRDIKLITYYLFSIFIIKSIFGNGQEELDIYLLGTNYFKVRYVIFINPFIMILSYNFYRKNKFQIANLLILTYGLICMALDARSNGLIFIVSAILLYLKTRKTKLSKTRLIIYSFIIIIILYGSYIIYVDNVLNNNFGGMNAKTQLKMASDPYDPFELLYYGRADFILLIQAVIDKPIVGHGSWGEDIGGKYNRILSAITGSQQLVGPQYISAHSIFLGTWAYAGIVGFIATIFMFYKLFSYYIKIYKLKLIINILPILTILFVDMLWAFFFSPIGTFRTSFPIFAAVFIVTNEVINKGFNNN